MHRSGERLRRSGGRLHCVVIGSFRFLLTFSIGRLGCLSNLNTLGSLCIFLKIKFATPAGSGTFLSLSVNFGISQTRRIRGPSVFTTFSKKLERFPVLSASATHPSTRECMLRRCCPFFTCFMLFGVNCINSARPTVVFARFCLAVFCSSSFKVSRCSSSATFVFSS